MGSARIFRTMRLPPRWKPAGLFLAVGAMLGGGCQTSPPGSGVPRWVEHTVEHGPPRRDMFEICVVALYRSDFPPGDRDEVTGRVVSGWDIHLHPWAGRGSRSQAVVQIEDRGKGNYGLRVRVKVQSNQEQHRTLELGAADGEDAPDDVARARLVMQQVLAQLR